MNRVDLLLYIEPMFLMDREVSRRCRWQIDEVFSKQRVVKIGSMDRGSVKRYRNKPRKILIEVTCFFLIGNLRTIINEKK